jgi:hypothetical protein
MSETFLYDERGVPFYDKLPVSAFYILISLLVKIVYVIHRFPNETYNLVSIFIVHKTRKSE